MRKICSSKLLSLWVFSTNVNQWPKFVLTSCPFCCCFNLVLMWQKALKNKLKNALRLTQTELQISLCSHHTLLRQAIELTLATATSPHLCTLLLLSSLICATDAHSIMVHIWSAWVLYEVAHILHSWLILILELKWK